MKFANNIGKKQNYEYSEQNRLGDHICYYSDLSKIFEHYPQFTIINSLHETIRQIVEAHERRSELSVSHLSSKLLLVTETPPGTPNGFGVTLDCMFKEIEHGVVYTDAAFKQFGDKLGYLLAQVPYHPSGRFLLSFLAGRFPNGGAGFVILVKHLSDKFSAVYRLCILTPNA